MPLSVPIARLSRLAGTDGSSKALPSGRPHGETAGFRDLRTDGSQSCNVECDTKLMPLDLWGTGMGIDVSYASHVSLQCRSSVPF